MDSKPKRQELTKREFDEFDRFENLMYSLELSLGQKEEGGVGK